MNIVNITAYRFVSINENELPKMCDALRSCGQELGVKGTIYIGKEGINFSLAGERQPIEKYKAFLNSYKVFKDLYYKESLSGSTPFSKMMVKIKPEIIRMDCETVEPIKKTVPHLSPEDFKRWYEQKKEMVVLDTRNDYEYAVGSFDDAIDLNIENFRDFLEAVKKLPEEYKKKPIVTFCTGGVRCEKAGEYMRQQGFEEVYQLDGGIINYFIKAGGDHWHGDCFVFDDRVTINSKLAETRSTTCFNCKELPAKQAATCKYCHQLTEIQEEW